MKKISLLFLVLFLSSCTTMHYGNFTHSSPNSSVYLAHDAALQLATVYPPAQTTFYLGQNTHDGFGVQLLKELRQKGYGVLEKVSAQQKANFFYVVDAIPTESLYRVSLYINADVLSRVYTTTNGALSPVSAWSHQEANDAKSY